VRRPRCEDDVSGRWTRETIGRADAQVGISLFHTVGDRERAVEQMATDFAGAYGDLFTAMGWRPDHPELDEASPLYQFWAIDVKPTVDEWSKFRDEQRDSYFTRWATNWETYESWQERLKRLRELIRARLGHMTSAEPLTLPTTILADAEDAAKKVVDKTFDVAKVATVAAIGVGGAVLIYALIRHDRRAG